MQRKESKIKVLLVGIYVGLDIRVRPSIKSGLLMQLKKIEKETVRSK
jgi:hypothetical protein